jgi:hypothetical protein
MGCDCEEMRAGFIDASHYKICTNVSLVSLRNEISDAITNDQAHWKRYCCAIVTAVATRGFRPLDSECNAMLEEINVVTKSVSAAVPAPQTRMNSEM